MQEKRRRDVRSRINRSEWTPAEDDRLRFLLSLYKYGYDEISRDLNRSEGAIRRRIASLGIKTLPIRRPGKWWSQEDKDKLVKMRADHESWETIALTLGRSASACRGQYERILNPEMMRRYVRDGKLRLNDCFQRNSCIHYTRALGCDLCGTNCDECEHYQRRNPEDDIPTGYVSSAAGKVGTKRVRRMQG